MSARFKPLAGQVIVVTGAGSGLGLETARLAAEAGAAVVLAARRRGERSARPAKRSRKPGGDAAIRWPAIPATASRLRPCGAGGRGAVRTRSTAGSTRVGGEGGPLAHAAAALAKHLSDREDPGALVAFGARIGREARAELRQAKGKIAATLVKLPKDWPRRPPDVPGGGSAALHAGHPGRWVSWRWRPRAKALPRRRRRASTPACWSASASWPWLARPYGSAVAMSAAAAAAASAEARARRVGPVWLGRGAKRRPLMAGQTGSQQPRGALRLARTYADVTPLPARQSAKAAL